MADKLMYIPNNDTENYPFCRLDYNQCSGWIVNKPTNPMTVPKVVNPTTMKTLT